MADPTVITSSFGTILLACQNHLCANVTLLQSNPKLCLLVGKDDVPRFQGDADVLLKPGAFHSVQPSFDGAGRTCAKIARYLIVYPRVRLALDEGDRDDLWLTHATAGLFQFEEACLQALWGYCPMNTNRDHLVIEPIRLADGIDPTTTGNEWGDSAFTFDVQYLSLLQALEWDPPIITTTSLPDGTNGVAYSQSVSRVNGTSPFTFSVSAGTLPTGLSMSSAGSITGTPTATGTYIFSVLVADGNSQNALKSYTVTIS